ncbi:MAG: response regulator [Planctomycetes bacterium]|nr:response regulator [Planctomycetota bacterium]
MAPASHIVLIADDDRLVRESLGDAFDAFGWEVRVADCGTSAIQVLERGRLDLLVSDIDMPDMTGFQLLSWTRAHPPALPVVLMSARADEQLGRTALAEGAVTLLPKPVPVARLNTVITTLFH